MAVNVVKRAAIWQLSQSHGTLFHTLSDCCRKAAPPAELLRSRACHSSTSEQAEPKLREGDETQTGTPSTDAAAQSDQFQPEFRFEKPEGFDSDFFPVQLLREPYGMQGDKRVTRAQKIAAKLATKGIDRRLQYHHIPVPENVTVQAIGTRLFFTGPLGSNAIDLEKIDDQGLSAFKLQTAEDGRITGIDLAGPSKSIMGTARTLLHNKINGVSRGYLVYMQLAGVGFRVSKENKDVTFSVGS
eukprot:jgi/Ulvmu1/8526/UM044_0060.1